MEHGHVGGNLHTLVGSGSTGGRGSSGHKLWLAIRPDHLASCENVKVSVRHFNGYFLVTGPDTEPAKFKTRQQALTWYAAHYPDLPIKEDRPKPPKTPAAPAAKREAEEDWGRNQRLGPYV